MKTAQREAFVSDDTRGLEQRKTHEDDDGYERNVAPKHPDPPREVELDDPRHDPRHDGNAEPRRMVRREACKAAKVVNFDVERELGEEPGLDPFPDEDEVDDAFEPGAVLGEVEVV